MAIRQPRRLICLAAGTLCLTALVATPSAAASRPDLKVTSGSASLSPSGERISGRFTVRNAGAKPAGVSTAYVQAKVSGKWRYVTELRILRLPPRNNDRYEFGVRAPSFLRSGKHVVRVCLDVKKKVAESRESNNCRTLGRVGLVHGPFSYRPDRKFFHDFQGGGYWGWVPNGYDGTPSALFVWLHGCGGRNEFDIESFHAPSADDYVTIAPTGREGGCWSPPGSGVDEGIVSSVIADARKHLNIDPERIVLGGYSSGGDLSYRYAYHHSAAVEAVLVANSTPFRDTGLTQQQALDASTTEFRVVHLAHTGDTTYPINTVRSELQVLINNQFPVTQIEQPGTHYDEPGPGVPGTDADIQTHLLPHVDP